MPPRPSQVRLACHYIWESAGLRCSDVSGSQLLSQIRPASVLYLPGPMRSRESQSDLGNKFHAHSRPRAQLKSVHGEARYLQSYTATPSGTKRTCLPLETNMLQAEPGPAVSGTTICRQLGLPSPFESMHSTMNAL